MVTNVARRVDWLKVGGRWTRVSVMGSEAPHLTSEESRGRPIILMIPGNPGNEAFYADFGRRILDLLWKRDPGVYDDALFVTISHLNHVSMPRDLHGSVEDHSHDDCFDLKDQIQHKADFIREYLGGATKIYIFAHSIGSYMMLRFNPLIEI